MKTQYDRIARHLRNVGRHGATYLDLSVVCHVTCPWKRISEMEGRGWRFRRKAVPHRGRLITIVSLLRAPARG